MGRQHLVGPVGVEVVVEVVVGEEGVVGGVGEHSRMHYRKGHKMPDTLQHRGLDFSLVPRQ